MNLCFVHSPSEIELKLKELKPKLVADYNVSRIGYFGSYALGKQTVKSDLDILVEFSQPIGWSFFSLERFLETSLSIKVDLVTPGALKERMKTQILAQVRFV
jgi:predicted nucleotidyltransferase